MACREVPDFDKKALASKREAIIAGYEKIYTVEGLLVEIQKKIPEYTQGRKTKEELAIQVYTLAYTKNGQKKAEPKPVHHLILKRQAKEKEESDAQALKEAAAMHSALAYWNTQEIDAPALQLNKKDVATKFHVPYADFLK